METANAENSGQRVRIFPPAWERAVLFLGVLPLVFALWDPGWFQQRWKMQIVADLLFLNVIHNAFSFYIMWRSDEVRRAIRENTGGHPWRLHLRAVTVFSLGMMLYFVFHKHLVAEPLFYILTVGSLEFLALQHARSQIMGLSLLYDHQLSRQFSLTDAEKKRLATAAKYERIFHRVALLAIAIRAGVWADRLDEKTEIWGFFLHLSTVLLVIGTVGLVVTHVVRPHWRKSNQWIFGLRRTWEIIPAFFNPAYIVFQRFNHGFEYLAVTASIDRNAKKSRPRAIAVAVFLGLVALRGFVYIHQMFLGSAAKVPAASSVTAPAAEANPLRALAFTGDLAEVTFLLAIVSLSVSLVHYYYDSQIFRFSRPEFREGVLPLIAPSRNSKS